MQIGKYIALTDRLTSPYREVFDQVEAYAQNHLVDEKIMAEKMMDLIDLLLQAQEKGESAEEIVGGDVQTFCKNFFSDLTPLDLLKSGARQLKTWAWWILVFELLWMFVSFGEEDFHIFSYQSDISGYLCGILIVLLSYSLSGFVSIVFAKFGYFSKWIRIGTTLGICIAGWIFIFSGFEREILLPGLPLLLASFAYLVFYYALLLWGRFRRTGSFKRGKNEYMTSFTGLVKEEVLQTNYAEDKKIVKVFAKRYRRKNARRIRMGKSALSTEEFFALEKKQSRLAGRLGAAIGFGIVFLSAAVNSLLSGEAMFENVWDFLIYIGIMALILFLFFRFSDKIDRVADRERNSILAACRKNGTELDRFYENLASHEKNKK